jgi:endonuclease-3
MPAAKRKTSKSTRKKVAARNTASKSTAKKKTASKSVRNAATKSVANKVKSTAKQSPPRRATRTFHGMTNPERAIDIIDVLAREYPDAHCQLNFSSGFELLIATILAAQCTDAMVNRVTPELFERYPDPQAFVDAPSEDIEKAIFKTGFYRNKTRSIKKCCQALLEEHGGEVPSTMEELVALGGVGRKTANCVLGNVFGIPGIVVDTHVKRLSNRMGFTIESNPDKIEFDLNKIVPESEWTHLSHLLADHGRGACAARSPRCDECPIEHLCPRIFD